MISYDILIIALTFVCVLMLKYCLLVNNVVILFILFRKSSPAEADYKERQKSIVCHRTYLITIRRYNAD
ncbi:hypothetical protein O3M35_007888 [Rhynocoris fuscipes]|uniref:ATP synthase F0 subunit 8 n=1 Tax=Rhynocoris fuscipes TaxID=488301 RepID=A0AAW1DBT0_9HEMI